MAAGAPHGRFHVRGRGLPDGEPVQWWIADGVLRREPVRDATTIFEGRWIIPGLVDAHCHVGLSPRGPVALDEAIAQAEVERDAGALLLRDCGSPTDTRPSEEVLTAAVAAAHAEGARVTAHVFGEEALPGLVSAGIDCIEHGTGLTEGTAALMAERGTALVPTLINIENFPGFADAATKFPVYAAHMRDLYARCRQRIGAAREAGVPIYAGSDAGGFMAHGQIAREVEALKVIGMTPTEALGAACWRAREWLGGSVLADGAPADLLCFTEDPRSGPRVLSRPDRVILRGLVY